MGVSVDKIREDFDRIALLTADDGEHPVFYTAFLLEQIPRSCASVLEIGCGAGALCRELASRGCEVHGVDLSPEMIRVARERTPSTERVTYEGGDFFVLVLPEAAYDCVVSVATLHHLPLAAAVARMAALVRPGGVLVIHDIRTDAGLPDRMRSVAAMAASAWTRLRAGQLRTRAAVRAAWREHGRGERYLTMPEVHAWQHEHLPGALAFRHLRWRYTVVWRKPGD